MLISINLLFFAINLIILKNLLFFLYCQLHFFVVNVQLPSFSSNSTISGSDTTIEQLVSPSVAFFGEKVQSQVLSFINAEPAIASIKYPIALLTRFLYFDTTITLYSNNNADINVIKSCTDMTLKKKHRLKNVFCSINSSFLHGNFNGLLNVLINFIQNLRYIQNLLSSPSFVLCLVSSTASFNSKIPSKNEICKENRSENVNKQ